MNAQQLKKSILQWAMQGKLIPQNPNDEPASILLTKIQQEKEVLIQQKKIKPTKNPSYIFRGEDGLFYETINNTTKSIQNEIPFDIPTSWEWVRLGEVASIYTGNSINENEKKKHFMGINTGRPYIATKDIEFNNSINYENGVFIPPTYHKFRVAPQNSVLLCIEGGSAGRKIGLITKEVCFGNKLCCFHSDFISMLFLFFYLQSPNFTNLFTNKITGIIGGVSLTSLKTILLPIPPLEEQKRIVNILEQVQALCTQLTQ